MTAVNYSLIIVVNEMLRRKRLQREAEERARRIAQETAEYNRIKESVLKKASEPEKVLATYSNGQVKEKTAYGYHYEYYEIGRAHV